MNKEKRSVRFGLIDVIIILLVLAVIGAGLWFFFGSMIFNDGYEAKITYEVRLTEIKSEFTSRIQWGDSVYDSVYGELIGTVSKVRTEQYTEQVLDKSTGEFVNTVKSGYYNVYITIDATARYSEKEHAYYAAETEIKVGKAMSVRLQDFSGVGYCIALENAQKGE